jgi:hypothetical protein
MTPHGCEDLRHQRPVLELQDLVPGVLSGANEVEHVADEALVAIRVRVLDVAEGDQAGLVAR